MKLETRNVSESDFDDWVELLHETVTDPATGEMTDEWAFATWPNKSTERGRQDTRGKLTKLLATIAPGCLLKVVDVDAPKPEAMVGFVAFTENRGDPPEVQGIPGDYWDDHLAHKAYADAIYRHAMENRRREYLKGPQMTNMSLAIKPSYQRKGAGSLLMRELCAFADARGLPCQVDSTEAGRGLYEKFGFELLETRTRPVVPGWEHRPKSIYHFMKRSAQAVVPP